jgi:hypothetical protein
MLCLDFPFSLQKHSDLRLSLRITMFHSWLIVFNDKEYRFKNNMCVIDCANESFTIAISYNMHYFFIPTITCSNEQIVWRRVCGLDHILFCALIPLLFFIGTVIDLVFTLFQDAYVFIKHIL